jgi:hypothetical protein
MSELIESPRNEITIEFSGLSVEERDELETFLTAQPEVHDVRRRYQVRDHAPGQDTLGLITHVVYHFALELAKGVARNVAANAILERLKARFPSRTTAQTKQPHQEEKGDQEYEWFLRWEGHILRSVKRPVSDD